MDGIPFNRSSGVVLPLLSQIDSEIARRNAEKATADLHTFFRLFAWPVIQPVEKFVDNWHISAICEHLQAVHTGQIKKLIINLPFRMLKSSLVTQTFPAWEWITRPGLQYLTSSYARDLATRDAVQSRRIIESDAYQTSFGTNFSMTSDQNVKTRYDNNKGGSRTITSTDGAVVGFGGNRVVVDDPINAQEADSEPARLASIEFWKGSLATRRNNPMEDAFIIVHQRINQNDLTGYLMREEKGWETLVLPMRYEREHTKTTSLGFVDPRKNEGELLHPARVDETATQELEVTLGSYHTEAQLQQHPGAREGTIFFRRHWKFYTRETLPQIHYLVISVDCAFKDLKSSDYVAIQAWGVNGANKYLLRRLKEHLGAAGTIQAVRNMRALYPTCNAVLIEDKANGSAVIEQVKKDIPGVIAINPEGGKISRGYAIQPQHEAGNLWLPDASIDPTIEVYLTELTNFPGAPNDDEADATTQAINYLRRPRVATQSGMFH